MPIATPVHTQASQPTIESLKAKVAALTVEAPATSESLRAFSSFDNTPAIGTEFREYSKDGKPVLSIRDVLGNEERLRALGRLVSERGVVFFRDAVISPTEQKELVQALSRLGGAPPSSGLHIHPLTLKGSDFGDEISVISNKFLFDKTFKRNDYELFGRPHGSLLWHSDITFEPVPSDYACLQIRERPETGGDTLWASAYEAYDRLSPAYKRFLDGLTATHRADHFIEAVRESNAYVRTPRGSPENSNTDLTAVHPVIRTNPVTGWKGLFVNKEFTKRINELTEDESNKTLDFLYNHIAGNHDLQVRFRWETNSLAIWDNRSTFHAATHDIDSASRTGTRSVTVGEKPYFDPNSKSRREALAAGH